MILKLLVQIVSWISGTLLIGGKGGKGGERRIRGHPGLTNELMFVSYNIRPSDLRTTL